ncbi:MAG: ISH3 family transposase [Cyanobacteria bacterium P01_A01_bin.40]
MENQLDKLVLTQEETLTEVVNCLAKHISLNSTGAGNPQNLFKLLVRAASKQDTIENTSKELKTATCGNNIRYHLGKISDFKQVENQLNLALKSKIPQGLKKKRLVLAIDLNLIPYYGKPKDFEKSYIYRSKAKDGTCSFYAYATLYTIKKGKRVTLGIRGVRCQDTKVCILTCLLAELSSLKIKVKRLYLDREFFSIAVIRWLKALEIPLAMPAIMRGKQGGIKQFLKGRKSYKTTYTMSRSKDDFVTFDIWIICKYKKGNRGQNGIKYYVYVTYKVKINLNHVHQCYRQRFGIESSYRLKNLCRIRSTTKQPNLRLLFVGISFLLVNIWVNLLWRKISKPRQGGRLIYQTIFPLRQMLSFINQAVERIFQVVETIYIPLE